MPGAGLRVLSYNVHDLLDDADAVAHVIRCVGPDVACLQEVPRRPFTRRRVQGLARSTGLDWVAGGRGSGGTAVFARPSVHVVSSLTRRLPVAGLLTRTRGYALARLSLPGAALTVMSVHLPLRPGERLAHVRLVLQQLRTLPPPWVVAGDLNEPPSGPAWAAFGAELRDAFGQLAASAGAPASGLGAVADPASGQGGATFPAKAPARRIDAILVSDDLTVERCAIAGAAEHLTSADLRAASDHLPLLADVRLRILP